MANIRTSTRARLFDAAAILIGEQGLHATTVDQIVELAGVAKGTVYYHFRSKNELFQALLIEGLNRLAVAFRAETEEAPGPVEALTSIVEAELENINRYEPFARLMMSQLWRADSLWSDEALRVLREEIIAVIQGVLEAGQASGDFRPNLDAHMAAPVIFGMVATAALGLTRAGATLRAEEAVPHLLDMALSTVRRNGE
jgi:AcrR family transcriptional regulator